MPRPPVKTVEEYKKYVIKRLEDLTPIFRKISQGDFSVKIRVPEKEDEFTPLLVFLTILLEDLKLLDKENQEKTARLEKAKLALEGKVKERTKELQKKIEELQRFQKFSVGRELKMVELKKELDKVNKELEKHKGRES